MAKKRERRGGLRPGIGARPQRPQAVKGPTDEQPRPFDDAIVKQPIDQLIDGQDHTKSFDSLRDTHPLLLLPVRLETRFEAPRLKVRIYPDQIHLDEHRAGLSAAELELGRAFWSSRLADESPEARASVEQWFADQLPARRAAWVARRTRPTKEADGTLTFPKLRARADAPAAVAAALPDRWAVVGWVNGTQRFVKFGNAIPDKLAFSPALGDAAAWSSNADALPVDAEMAWMIDYQDAVARGMGVTIDLEAIAKGLYAEVEEHGLTLLVVGIAADRPRDAAAQLASLFEAHHYTDGLEFVPQGTATNNTDAAIAGWTATVDDLTDHFARELDDVFPEAGSNAGARRLAWALGLDAERLLVRVLHGDHDDESSAAAMNRVLWPATWGRYFDDMLAPIGGRSILPADTHASLREWFIDHVRAGAPLPTLVIGAQPYGVLPVRRSVDRKALSGWQDTLEWILLDLRERWRESLLSVPRLDPVVGGVLGGTAEDDAVTILGSVPHPGRFVVRRLTYQHDIRLFLWDLAWLKLDDPSHELHALGDWYRSQAARITGIESQLEVLRELEEEIPRLLPASLRADGENVVEAMIAMAEAHRVRQEPLHQYFPASINGVFASGAVQASDPKLFWSGYGNATADKLFTRPLVEAEHASAGERAATYLASLRARLPSPIIDAPEPMPIGTLLGSMALSSGGKSRRETLRAARRERQQLPISEIVAAPGKEVGELPGKAKDGEGLSESFFANKPLLYQLIDKVIDTVEGTTTVQYRAALSVLAATATEQLELRLRETLGLATHRLDAWLTGFAHQRLQALREQAGVGVQLGGFAWVENLRPDAAGVAETQGFIHAPSLAHAATAAVLRSGWQSHGTSAADSTLAVDLRSDRVRLAAWLLDGIRQGQALGDLLGCQFERRLHDQRLDRFIDDCRRAVLASKGIDREPRAPVDGLELAELYQGAGVLVGETTIKPGATYANPSHRSLRDAIEQILTSMDAVADASIADSVHHVLQGNTDRASATLDAVSTGAVPPPGLRGLRTPRPGIGVTHRLMLMLADASESDPDASPRAKAEPALERWVASLLPDLGQVLCRVRFAANEGELAPEPITLTLAQLVASFGMSALDVVYTAPAGTAGAGDGWSRRIAAHVLGQASYATWSGRLILDLAASDIELPESAVSFAQLADLAQRLRALLGNARSLDGRELGMPGAEIDPAWDLDELDGRVRGLQADFQRGLRRLLAVLPEASEAQPHPIGSGSLEQLRKRMRGLDGHELDGAIATTGWIDDELGRAQLYEEAWQLADRAGARVDALAQLQARWDQEDLALAGAALADEVRLRRIRQRAVALFGRGFPLLPRFMTPDAATVAAALARSEALLEGDFAVATDWLQKIAKVRAGAAALDEAMALAELICDASRLRPIVGQLPINPNERWAAISAPQSDNERESQGRLALFVLDDGGVAALSESRPIHGLVFDAWLDQVPARELVTGVALHFDAPSSRPPQALLLLVPPAGESWSFDLVVDSLMETFEAAQLRAIDPDILLAHGHQAPAIFPPGELSAGAQPEASE